MPVLNIRTNAQKWSVCLFLMMKPHQLPFIAYFYLLNIHVRMCNYLVNRSSLRVIIPATTDTTDADSIVGGGGGNLAALRVNQYYQNYYKRYNAIQAIRVLSRTIQGLRFSSLLSIGKHTLFLFHKFFLIISIMSVRGFYIFLIYCFYHLTSLCINFYGLSAFVGVGPRPL